VTVILDRIHGLPGDIDPIGQFGLGQLSLRTKHPDSVLHARTSAWPIQEMTYRPISQAHNSAAELASTSVLPSVVAPTLIAAARMNAVKPASRHP
jgi:hypothetical protein